MWVVMWVDFNSTHTASFYWCMNKPINSLNVSFSQAGLTQIGHGYASIPSASSRSTERTRSRRAHLPGCLLWWSSGRWREARRQTGSWPRCCRPPVRAGGMHRSSKQPQPYPCRNKMPRPPCTITSPICKLAVRRSSLSGNTACTSRMCRPQHCTTQVRYAQTLQCQPYKRSGLALMPANTLASSAPTLSHHQGVSVSRRAM